MKKWPILLLAIWLIATGIFTLFEISFSGQTVIMALLEIAAGVFLVLAGKKVKVFHHLGSLLLAIWLMISGFFWLLNISFDGSVFILAILGIVAAVFMLLGKKKLSNLLSALFLAIWLILCGIIVLLALSFTGMGMTMGILAILAGIFLFLHKK